MAHWGPWLVLAVGLGAVGLTLTAFGVFLYTHLIGESKGDAHGHGHSDPHH